MTSDVLTNSPWLEHSGTDLIADRAEADRAQYQQQRLRATRVVAAAARNSSDAVELLAMLGIDDSDVRSALGHRTVAA